MAQGVILHGYRYSVYNRIVRAALYIKDVEHNIFELDPFTEVDPAYLELHPFGRVPVLTHASFSIYETQAITRYIDHAFDGLPLQPQNAQALARMNQIIGVIDNYAYWPMIRQVFSQRVFQPLVGEKPDEREILIGLEASKKVLGALESIAKEKLVLDGDTITLADCHLAPVMEYFTSADEGRKALLSYPALNKWWEQISSLPMMSATDPKLMKLKG